MTTKERAILQAFSSVLGPPPKERPKREEAVEYLKRVPKRDKPPANG